MGFKNPAALKFKGMILLLLSIAVVSAGALLYLALPTLEPVKVENQALTNITSSGFSIVWSTDKAVSAAVEIANSDEFRDASVFYDDRDIFEGGMNEYVKVEDNQRKLHHVTVRGLEPERQYFVRIKNNKQTEEPMKLVTTRIIETLQTPDPIYGKIANANGENVNDGVVLMKKVAPNGESQLVSAVLEDGSYSLDGGNLMKADFTNYFTSADYAENLKVMGMEGALIVKSFDVNKDKDQPVKEINIQASEEEIKVQVQNEEAVDIEVYETCKIEINKKEYKLWMGQINKITMDDGTINYYLPQDSEETGQDDNCVMRQTDSAATQPSNFVKVEADTFIKLISAREGSIDVYQRNNESYEPVETWENGEKKEPAPPRKVVTKGFEDTCTQLLEGETGVYSVVDKEALRIYKDIHGICQSAQSIVLNNTLPAGTTESNIITHFYCGTDANNAYTNEEGTFCLGGDRKVNEGELVSETIEGRNGSEECTDSVGSAWYVKKEDGSIVCAVEKYDPQPLASPTPTSVPSIIPAVFVKIPAESSLCNPTGNTAGDIVTMSETSVTKPGNSASKTADVECAKTTLIRTIPLTKTEIKNEYLGKVNPTTKFKSDAFNNALNALQAKEEKVYITKQAETILSLSKGGTNTTADKKQLEKVMEEVKRTHKKTVDEKKPLTDLSADEIPDNIRSLADELKTKGKEAVEKEVVEKKTETVYVKKEGVGAVINTGKKYVPDENIGATMPKYVASENLGATLKNEAKNISKDSKKKKDVSEALDKVNKAVSNTDTTKKAEEKPAKTVQDDKPKTTTPKAQEEKPKAAKVETKSNTATKTEDKKSGTTEKKSDVSSKIKEAINKKNEVKEEKKDTKTNTATKSGIKKVQAMSEDEENLISILTEEELNYNVAVLTETVEPGTYAISGSDTVNKQFAVTGGTTIVYFVDYNEDGIKQENEPLYDGDVENLDIKFEKVSESQNYTLQAGWNLISFPILTRGENTSEIITAYDLLNDISDNGFLGTHAVVYRSGKFVSYSLREDSTGAKQEFGENFSILPGEAYFVKIANTGGTYVISGFKIDGSQQLALQNGWNLVGIYNSSEESYKGFDILKQINTAAIQADAISKWENGTYANLILQNNLEYGNDFNIYPYQGCFIRVQNKGTGIFKP